MIEVKTGKAVMTIHLTCLECAIHAYDSWFYFSIKSSEMFCEVLIEMQMFSNLLLTVTYLSMFWASDRQIL
jgi:hypothetical protein